MRKNIKDIGVYYLALVIVLLVTGCGGGTKASPTSDLPTNQPTPSLVLTNTEQLEPTEELPIWTPEPPAEGVNETLLTLQNALVPENNLRELAMRLKGIENIPETVPDQTLPQKGDIEKFWGDQC